MRGSGASFSEADKIQDIPLGERRNICSVQGCGNPASKKVELLMGDVFFCDKHIDVSKEKFKVGVDIYIGDLKND